MLGSVTMQADRFVFATSLWVLFGSGDMRGSDKVIPGVPGTRPLPRRPTSSQYTIPITVVGELTSTNTASTLDPTDQAARNLTYLVGTLVTGGMVGCQVTIGSGSRSGSVFVEAISPTGGGPGWVQADMTLAIPAGRLT